MTEPTNTLAKKLCAVMAAVDRIPKRGYNSAQDYWYATEADTVDTLRKELVSRSVMMFSDVIEMKREQLPKGGLTHIKTTHTFYDCETGESRAGQWYGCGWDGLDKGLYKAITGAEKTFLLKTFLVPTGDDPERDDAAQPDERPEQARPARPVPKNDGNLYVTEVKASVTKNGKKRWTVYFSDGQKADTYKAEIGELATSLEGRAVTVEIGEPSDPKFNGWLNKIEPAGNLGHPLHGEPAIDEPELSADELFGPDNTPF